MAYTQAQLDAVDTAIASGALKVDYGDRSVTYRSVAELLRARQVIADSIAAVSGATPVARRSFASFSRD